MENRQRLNKDNKTMLINENLHEARFRSFFMNGELLCKFIILFFRTSISGWSSITISEGLSTYKILNSEPKLIELQEIDDDFAYPISPLESLNNFLGMEMSAIYEYRINKVDEGCIGIYFEFGNSGFSVLDVDNCLLIKNGIQQFTDKEVSLCKTLPQ